MGLLGAVLSLPLAPARGVSWAIRQVLEEAEAEQSDPRRIRAQLVEAEEALAAGEITVDEYDAIERDLFGRLG